MVADIDPSLRPFVNGQPAGDVSLSALFPPRLPKLVYTLAELRQPALDRFSSISVRSGGQQFEGINTLANLYYQFKIDAINKGAVREGRPLTESERRERSKFVICQLELENGRYSGPLDVLERKVEASFKRSEQALVHLAEALDEKRLPTS